MNVVVLSIFGRTSANTRRAAAHIQHGTECQIENIALHCSGSAPQNKRFALANVLCAAVDVKERRRTKKNGQANKINLFGHVSTSRRN